MPFGAVSRLDSWQSATLKDEDDDEGADRSGSLSTAELFLVKPKNRRMLERVWFLVQSLAAFKSDF